VIVEFAKDRVDSEQERFANVLAGDFLIPPDRWRSFTTSKNYSEAAIKHFATLVDMDPGIVVGRLQKENRVPWRTRLTYLKKRYMWTDNA
jgi:HTH-type transcriptional regulator/antitoxin HigA